MKTPARSLRFLPLAALCLTAPFVAAAAPAGDSDRASALLVRQGSIAVASAGPYVEAGTYRIQVSAKLGRADVILPDGTWLYHGHRVVQSDAEGTLVVRFQGNRVSALAIVTPAVAVALQSGARQAKAADLLAAK